MASTGTFAEVAQAEPLPTTSAHDYITCAIWPMGQVGTWQDPVCARTRRDQHHNKATRQSRRLSACGVSVVAYTRDSADEQHSLADALSSIEHLPLHR